MSADKLQVMECQKFIPYIMESPDDSFRAVDIQKQACRCLLLPVHVVLHWQCHTRQAARLKKCGVSQARAYRSRRGCAPQRRLPRSRCRWRPRRQERLGL